MSDWLSEMLNASESINDDVKVSNYSNKEITSKNNDIVYEGVEIKINNNNDNKENNDVIVNKDNNITIAFTNFTGTIVLNKNSSSRRTSYSWSQHLAINEGK